MPTFRITSPEGKVYEVTGPEGSTQEQALARVQAQAGAQSEATPKDGSSFLGRTSRDLAAGAVRGAASIGATLLAPIDAGARALGISNDFIGRNDRRESLDSALQSLGADTSSLAYGAGKLGAEVAGTLGVGGAIANGTRLAAQAGTRVAAAIEPLTNAIASGGMRLGVNAPTNRLAQLALRSAGGGVAGGASTALVDPGSTGQGAAIGAALPGAAAGVGRLGQLVGQSVGVNPRAAEIGRLAQQYDIPVTAGDVAGSTTKALRSVLADLPIVGGIGVGARESQQGAFNKAVGNTFGAPETSLTPAVVDAAKGRLGSEFERIWNNNNVQVDASLLNSVQALRTQADKLPAQSGGSVRAEIDDLLSKVQTDQAGNVIIPGDVANKFQSYLRRRAEGSTELRNELGDLRQSLIGAFNRSVSPADATALTQTRSQYKAFKTVEPLLTGAELGIAGRVPGDVPASLLPGAVRKGYSDPTGTALGDLSLVGSNILADRVARTGGSTRAAIQNTLLGASVVANPALAGLGYAGAGGLAALVNSPRLGAYLTRPGTNRLRDLIESSAATGLAQAAPVALSGR